jgi:hypothetical protein
MAMISYEANQPVTRYYYRMFQTQSTYTGTTGKSATFSGLTDAYYLFIVTARDAAGDFAPVPCRVWFCNRPVGTEFQVYVESYLIIDDGITFNLAANRPVTGYYVRLYSLEDRYYACSGSVTYSGLQDGLYYFVGTGREAGTLAFPPGGPARQFFYITTMGF